MLRYLQWCRYHFIVATFFLGLVMGLHDDGYLLLAFRDHLFDLMVGFIIFVLLLSTNFLGWSQHLLWCSLLLFFLVASFLLFAWFGAHLLTCVLFAVRCSITLRREGLLDRRHRCSTSQHRRWSWYPSWFRCQPIGAGEHVTLLPVLLVWDTVGSGGRVISARCYFASINI